jgi:hypothetical protein
MGMIEAIYNLTRNLSELVNTFGTTLVFQAWAGTLRIVVVMPRF